MCRLRIIGRILRLSVVLALVRLISQGEAEAMHFVIGALLIVAAGFLCCFEKKTAEQ